MLNSVDAPQSSFHLSGYYTAWNRMIANVYSDVMENQVYRVSKMCISTVYQTNTCTVGLLLIFSIGWADLADNKIIFLFFFQKKGFGIFMQGGK